MTIRKRYSEYCKKQEEKEIDRVKKNPSFYKRLMVISPLMFAVLWTIGYLVKRPNTTGTIFLFICIFIPTILIEYDLKRLLKKAGVW